MSAVHISEFGNNWRGNPVLCGLKESSVKQLNHFKDFKRQDLHKYCLKCLMFAKILWAEELGLDRINWLLNRDYPEKK